VAESGTSGMHVTVTTINGGAALALGKYMVTLLERLGYRTTLVTYPRINTTGSPSVTSWSTSSGELTMRPLSNFLATLLSCGGTVNFAQFCSPSVDAAIRDALRLQTTDPAAANDLWGRIDRMVVDQAAWVPLVTPHSTSSSAIVWATTRTRRSCRTRCSTRCGAMRPAR